MGSRRPTFFVTASSGHKKDCIVCSGNARQDDALVESERLYHERLFKAYAPDTVVAFGHEAQVVYSRFVGHCVDSVAELGWENGARAGS